MNAEHPPQAQATPHLNSQEPESPVQQAVSQQSLTEDAYDEAPSPAVYWGILAAGITLLLLLPDEASWVDTRRGWFTQPMTGSALGLSIMTLFAGWRVITGYRNWHPNRQLMDELMNAVSGYRVALLSSVLFFFYINSLDVIGFVPASLLFVTTLLWLSRLLNRLWFLAALGTLTALVLIFRVGLSLWLPDVWLYEQLPVQWADFANQYL